MDDRRQERQSDASREDWERDRELWNLPRPVLPSPGPLEDLLSFRWPTAVRGSAPAAPGRSPASFE